MNPDASAATRSRRELEIIRSAYRTMARRGSHRMSLREVADEAGVSKGLLLYHFGTKDTLLFAAMTWAVERTEERIRQGLETSDEPVAQLGALIDAIFIDAEANRDFYFFYLDLVEHAGRVPSFGELSTTLEKKINGLFGEVIQRGVDQGSFVAQDVEVAARNMRALIEGTFLQWIQTPDWRLNHPRWKESCREALLRQLTVL